MNTISSAYTTSTSMMFRTVREIADARAGEASAAISHSAGSTSDTLRSGAPDRAADLSETTTYYDAGNAPALEDDAAPSDDIRTASFMATLKEKLEDMAFNSVTLGPLGNEMLSALKEDVLSVTDSESGVMLTAWDVADPDEEGTIRKEGEPIAREGWGQFLKNHLQRATTAGATFDVSNIGAYTDAFNGNSAYFGKVVDQNVYLSWPKTLTPGSVE